jgi:hypothetical protein
MAIVITRTETQLSATTSFQAMDNLGGASVSSSFTVPTGVSAIKSITFSTSADGADEYVPLLKVSGNELSIAVTDAATISAAATVQFA